MTILNHRSHLSPEIADRFYVSQADIDATHPESPFNPDTCAADSAAMILVGERHEKRDLVNLVRTLLLKAENKLPAEMANLYTAASKGFHTSETCGPENKFIHQSKFSTLQELFDYEDAWRKAMIAAAPENKT